MRKYITWLVFFFGCLSGFSSWAKKEGELEGLQNPGFQEQPEWFKHSFLDIREDVAEAAEAGRRVMLYFYQDGCPYCKKLITVNFAQKAIADKTRRNFDVIAVNMWGDREVTDMQGESMPEKDFASKMRVMFTPTLIFLNEQRRKALRINGYFPPEKFDIALDYVSQKLENKLRFKTYLQQVKPVPSHGKLHREPYFRGPPFDLSKRVGGKEFLLVFVEQKECPACDELHTDILQRAETKRLLEAFDMLQLDMWSKDSLVTPGGKTLAINQWINEQDVKYAPTLMFFDKQGREVIRIEAYLKAFHIQSVLDYVASKAYLQEPSFQRYIDGRAGSLRAKGITVDLMR